MRYFNKIANLKEEYDSSPKGIVYVAPTGSGKTLKALQATRGQLTTAITPASLTKNFDQQELKFFNKKSPRTSVTYSKVSRGFQLPGGQNLLLDESHNIRNSSTKSFRALKAQRPKYKKVLLMTATPMYNEPYDIASQVNLVAGKNVVPQDRKVFYSKFYKDVQTSPGLLGRLLGIKPGSKRVLKSVPDTRKALDKYTYVVGNSAVKNLMPHKFEETVEVPMSERQQKMYKYYEGKMPFYLRYKMKRNILPSKTEAKSLNTFLSAVRQISNTTKPFEYPGAAGSSTKLDKMVSDAVSEVKHGGKVLMYSNFKDAGISQLSKRLTNKKIPHGIITGEVSKNNRSLIAKAYNHNKFPVMLYTGAGSEGLNLPKTTLIQTTEPYWNKARVNQAEARGIRRGDDPTRTVRVKKYVSVFPKRKLLGLIPMKRKTSVDQYLQTMSNKKNEEIQQMLTALRDR